MSSNSRAMGPIEKELHRSFKEKFNPVHLEIVNESAQHAGHRPPEESHGESHFRVVMVSYSFEGLTRIQRSRLVHDLLREKLQGPIHALSLRLLTPGEWDARS